MTGFDRPTSPTRMRWATIFALTVVLLDSVGFGLIIPVLPPLIEEVGGLGLDEAARVGGWLFAAFSLAQFVFAPLVGTLSDHWGRRPLLLVAIAGLAIDYVVQALAPSLPWLFAGRLVAGICGSSFVVANACLADVSPPERRAKVFGLVGAAFGLGFVLGPALGGLLGAFGTRVPFWAAGALASVNFLIGLLALPETLGPSARRPFRWREANPLGAFAVFRRFSGVLPLGGVLTLYFFGSSIYVAIWPYWGIAKFGWSAATIGLTLATSGVAMALLQGFGTGPSVTRWGERRLAVAGLAVGALACAGYGLAPITAVVVPILIVHAVEGFVHPLLAAAMSRAVPENAQGALQGGISALMNLAMLGGTLVFTQIFALFMAPSNPWRSPDASFAVAAAILAAACFWYVALTRRRTARPAETRDG